MPVSTWRAWYVHATWPGEKPTCHVAEAWQARKSDTGIRVPGEDKDVQDLFPSSHDPAASQGRTEMLPGEREGGRGACHTAGGGGSPSDSRLTA